MRIEIPEQVEWILKKLIDGGFEAFAVGGCVRDTLLGRMPEDWDITTSAKPEQVKQIFGRTIDTGLQHGTVTVLRDHIGYEITTYRIDGEYEDGRHPKEVSFTSDLKEDLRRRDFTINAMAYSHETGIVDIFGGMEDLKNGVIRCVGEPMERFTEDALRILRAIRFSAQLDFVIEEKTYRALSRIAPNLALVSKERIQVELTKTLLSAHPERAVLVEETGMSRYLSKTFPAIFEKQAEGEAEKENPGEAVPDKIPMADRWKRASALRTDKSLRWAAFLSGCGEQTAERILRELKLDNETIKQVKTYVFWLPQPFFSDPVFLRTVMSQMSDELFDGLLELKEILCREPLEAVRKTAAAIRSSGDCIRLKDMAVTGRDLMAAGMKPGPELGKLLDRLFQLVLECPEKNERELLLREVPVRQDERGRCR